MRNARKSGCIHYSNWTITVYRCFFWRTIKLPYRKKLFFGKYFAYKEFIRSEKGPSRLNIRFMDRGMQSAFVRRNMAYLACCGVVWMPWCGCRGAVEWLPRCGAAGWCGGVWCGVVWCRGCRISVPRRIILIVRCAANRWYSMPILLSRRITYIMYNKNRCNHSTLQHKDRDVEISVFRTLAGNRQRLTGNDVSCGMPQNRLCMCGVV